MGDSLGLWERCDLRRPHPYLPNSAPEIKERMLVYLEHYEKQSIMRLTMKK